jgi:hypothetical protein
VRSTSFRARNAASVLAVLVLLGALDRWLGSEEREGVSLRQIELATERAAAKPEARVLVLGSSTSDWLRPDYVAGALGRDPKDILDAHMNACLQDCSWAQVRGFSLAQRHFELALMGLNLYAMCEHPDVNRITQLVSLTEAENLPEVAALLARSGNPVRAWVRLAGVGLLHAYRDPRRLRTAIGSLLGAPSGARSASWVRPPDAARQGWVPVCAYSADDIRFKRLVMELLLEQLSALADRTVLIMLPDRAVTLEDPDHVRAWARHREILRELVAETPRATLMDLVDGGAQRPELYLDHVHLKAAGTRIQQELFEYRLTELGVR